MYLLNEIRVGNKLIRWEINVPKEEEKMEIMQKKIEKLQVQEAGYQGEMRNEKSMDMEFIKERMEIDMKDYIQKIQDKETELIIFQMEAYMRDCIQKVKSMDMEFIKELMEIDMKEYGQKIQDKEKEIIILQMEEYMRESFQKINYNYLDF